jgi:hypothetical protein
VWRKIFGPKRDEITLEWRKLLSEELCNLYSSQISLGKLNKENEVGRACGMDG